MYTAYRGFSPTLALVGVSRRAAAQTTEDDDDHRHRYHERSDHLGRGRRSDARPVPRPRRPAAGGRRALDLAAGRVGEGPAHAGVDPDGLGPLGVGAPDGWGDARRRAPHLRLLRVPRALLPHDLPVAGRAGARGAGRRPDAGHRDRRPAARPRPGPRRVRAPSRDVSEGRRPRAPDVDADAGSAAPLRPRSPATAAARRGRVDRRLGVPHPRPAVPPTGGRTRPPRAGRATSTRGPPRRSGAATWTS